MSISVRATVRETYRYGVDLLAAAPPANSDELLQRIDDLGLARLTSQILDQQAPSLRLVPGTASDLSFFGEPVALPEGLVRPSSQAGPLTCLLCLCLDDIAEEAGRHGLPTSGWLLFFIEPSDELLFGQGAPFNDGTVAVRHIADASLAPSTADFAGEFQRIAFEPIVTIPDLDIARQLWDLSDVEREAYDTLYSPQSSVTPGPAPPPFSITCSAIIRRYIVRVCLIPISRLGSCSYSSGFMLRSGWM